MPPPGDIHGHQQSRISALLHYEGEMKGHGQARGDVGIVLRRNPDRIVGPNAAFITNASLPVRRSKEGYLETIPELVVEVRSKNDTYEEVESKAEEYLDAGVRIVWSLDPYSKTVSIFEREKSTLVLTVNETLTADGVIPELAVPVAKLFPDS